MPYDVCSRLHTPQLHSSVSPVVKQLNEKKYDYIKKNWDIVFKRNLSFIVVVTPFKCSDCHWKNKKDECLEFVWEKKIKTTITNTSIKHDIIYQTNTLSISHGGNK